MSPVWTNSTVKRKQVGLILYKPLDLHSHVIQGDFFTTTFWSSISFLQIKILRSCFFLHMIVWFISFFYISSLFMWDREQKFQLFNWFHFFSPKSAIFQLIFSLNLYLCLFLLHIFIKLKNHHQFCTLLLDLKLHCDFG